MNNQEGTSVYKDMPFCNKTSKADFYVYSTIAEIVTSCKENTVKSNKYRTVGVFESINGQFYLSDIVHKTTANALKLRVSLCYLKTTLQSSALPYPVQMFGILQFDNEPVLFATIVQVLSNRIAAMSSEILQRVAQNIITHERHLPGNVSSSGEHT